MTLTEKIAEASARKKRLQECRHEAEATTRKYQNLKDEAEAKETDLSLQYMQVPTPELAVELKDARIETESLIKQHEQALKDLRNIPAGIKAAETEIRNLTKEKEAEISKLVRSKFSSKVAALEKKAKLAVAEYGAALVMDGSRNITGSSVEALMAHVTRDRTVLASMHEAYYAIEKKLGFDKL